MLKTTSQKIVIEGVTLEVVRLLSPQPQAKGPPIIMLHEGLGSISMWRDFPQLLALQIGCEIIVYSRAGYGNSGPAQLPRTVRYMHDEGLNVLPQMIAALDIHKPVLLGHSDGASIALICAGGTGVELSGIMLMAPHVMVEEIAVQSIEQARVAWQTTSLPERLGKYHSNVEAAFTGWNDIWLHKDFLLWNIEEYLDSIKYPVLAIQGLDDEYGTMAQIDIIAQKLPQTQLLKLPDCGHSPHKDQTESVLRAMSRFLHNKVECA